MKRFKPFWGVFVLLTVSNAFATVPKLINFQGILRDGSGNPVPNGSYSVAFKIYDAQAGGNVLWTEVQSIVPNGGFFNTLLGSLNSVPDSAFNGANRYLGITVESDPEMFPRYQLVSIGYAYRVNSVDGALGGTISGDLIGSGKGTFGFLNVASGFNATVSGGASDTASDSYATVSGGSINVASGSATTIGGGVRNRATDSSATVGGGFLNSAIFQYATVSGGFNNTASGDRSMVSGGSRNVASGFSAAVGGGQYNFARGLYSTVSGGGGSNYPDSNQAFGDYSAVGGGRGNIAQGFGSKVGGGGTNKATGSYSFVGGGIGHLASGSQATVTGGQTDTASAPFAAVGGGCGNSAKGSFAKAGGGFNNLASGFYSTVAGGDEDTATGDWSAIPGGQFNKAAGNYSFAAGRQAKALHHGTFVWADNTGAEFASTGTNQFLIRAAGGVGVGTTSPQGALDVSSTTGAFIVPRMSTAQRNALTPVNGMIVYNTTDNQFNFYENGSWVTK